MQIMSCLKYSLSAAIAAIGMLATTGSATAVPFLPAQVSAIDLSGISTIVPIRNESDRSYRRYRDDDDEDDDDDEYYDDYDVDAPTTYVGRRGRHVDVEAPFTSVERSRDGVYVRAPFVDLWVPRR